MLKNKSGYTMVEMTVVIMIVGILILSATGAYGNLLGGGDDRLNEEVCTQIRQDMYQDYLLEQQSDQDLTLAEFMANLSTYYKDVPQCPSGGTYAADGDRNISCTKHAKDIYGN